jgi:NifU-like protein involved in Fe-S cluster formation
MRADRERLTVWTCFDRGLRRSRHRWLPISGPPRTDGHGLRSQFSLDVSEGVVRAATFRSTTCITLIAYSELLAEWVVGMPLQDAIRLRPADLVNALGGVPPAKHDMAVLPVQALQSAIQTAVCGDTLQSSA